MYYYYCQHYCYMYSTSVWSIWIVIALSKRRRKPLADKHVKTSHVMLFQAPGLFQVLWCMHIRALVGGSCKTSLNAVLTRGTDNLASNSQ